MTCKGHIFFIAGVSGSGKSTLIEFLKSMNHPKFSFPLSYKTRKPRIYEIDGKDAHFLSKKDFFTSIFHQEFFEYACVHQQEYYGTKWKDIFDHGIFQGNIVFKEIDIQGLEYLKTTYPGIRTIHTSLFLYLPPESIIPRIKTRGDTISQEELHNRIASAHREIQKAWELCDYILDAREKAPIIQQKVLSIIQKTLMHLPISIHE